MTAAVVPEGMPEEIDWRGGIPGGGVGRLGGRATGVGAAAEEAAGAPAAADEADEAAGAAEEADDDAELEDDADDDAATAAAADAWRAYWTCLAGWLPCALAPTRKAERTTRASSFMLVVC